jgi:hypothetical protein
VSLNYSYRNTVIQESYQYKYRCPRILPTEIDYPETVQKCTKSTDKFPEFVPHSR